jgi:hypothetical protein
MKRFKQIDLGFSIASIIAFTIISLIRLDETFLYGYFIVGGWQVFSMVIHVFAGWFTEKNSVRRIYHWITFAVIAAGCLSLYIQIFLFVFVIMLYFAPFIAIFYTGMCYQELRMMNKRPLSDFK